MRGSLDQKKNYRAEFGFVYRSSAIFAVLPMAVTTISVLNYWKIKNGLDVSLVATCRDLGGSLLSREELDLASGSVVNFKPPAGTGSVEIEAYCNRNLRIPYAAVMGIYETPNAVTMVHAYARNHSPTEIEDGYAVLEAREACITLRADPDVETIAFFHNGSVPMPAQRATLILSNAGGEEETVSFVLPATKPYETVSFDFERIAPHLRSFLGGKDGWGALQFENYSGFPRMLVRWLNRKTGELQVTHSNFDYSEYETDLLSHSVQAYMQLPAFDRHVKGCQIVIYPRCTPGEYEFAAGSQVLETRGGGHFSASDREGQVVRVTRLDGPLPSRLVTAISACPESSALPFECSLGVLHEERPPKRFHWGVVSARLQSSIFLTAYPQIYGEPEGVELTFKLYGTGNHKAVGATRRYGSIKEMPSRLGLTDLFPDAGEILGDDPGYITVFCEWGGLMVFTSMQKEESLTIEHTF